MCCTVQWCGALCHWATVLQHSTTRHLSPADMGHNPRQTVCLFLKGATGLHLRWNKSKQCIKRRDRQTLEELQQTAILHQFSDNVDRLILRAHSVQLDQLAVSKLLHNLSLSKEVLWIHRSCHRHTLQDVNTAVMSTCTVSQSVSYNDDNCCTQTETTEFIIHSLHAFYS